MICQPYLYVQLYASSEEELSSTVLRTWWVCCFVSLQNFVPPSFDDRILEVVAVFGGMQIAVSRLIDLQHHRIAQVGASAVLEVLYLTVVMYLFLVCFVFFPILSFLLSYGDETVVHIDFWVVVYPLLRSKNFKSINCHQKNTCESGGVVFFWFFFKQTSDHSNRSVETACTMLTG